MDRLVTISSIKNKSKLHVEYKGQTYFGGKQSWFNDETMTFGACGPVCAFNLLHYYNLDQELLGQEGIMSQLEAMYDFIKPTEIHGFVPNYFIRKKLLPPTLGVRSINQFKKKLIRLADLKFPNQNLKIKEYRFSNSIDNTVNESIEFIKSSLNSNHPLCFLNTFHNSKLYLSNVLATDKSSSVKLESELLSLKSQSFITHWVLVTALYQSKSSGLYYLECSSWGQLAYFKLSDFHVKLNTKNKIFQSGMLRIEL